jgi:hypothetical protein
VPGIAKTKFFERRSLLQRRSLELIARSLCRSNVERNRLERTDYISVYYCLRIATGCTRVIGSHRERKTPQLFAYQQFRGSIVRDIARKSPGEQHREINAHGKREKLTATYARMCPPREIFRAGSHCFHYSNNPAAASDLLAIIAERALPRDAWRRVASVLLRIFSGSGQSGRNSDAPTDAIARHVTPRRHVT